MLRTLAVAALLALVVGPVVGPASTAIGGVLCNSRGYWTLDNFTTNDRKHSGTPPPLVVETGHGKNTLCHEWEGFGTAYSHWRK